MFPGLLPLYIMPDIASVSGTKATRLVSGSFVNSYHAYRTFHDYRITFFCYKYSKDIIIL
jgi:hypothetical protein